MTQTDTISPTTARVTKNLPFERTRVFDAWLDADAVRGFLCPHPGHVSHAELDPRVGGSYEIEMTVGEHVVMHTGEYLEISRPDRLVFTWISASTQGRTTEVTLDFIDRDGATELILTHTGLPSAEMAQNHHQGWIAILDRMAEQFS